MAAGMRINDVGVQSEIRDLIRNIGLQLQAFDHLVANLELRHFDHGLHLGILNGASSIGIHIQHTLKLQVTCLHCLQLIELDTARVQLRDIGLTSGLILKGGIYGPAGKSTLRFALT